MGSGSGNRLANDLPNSDRGYVSCYESTVPASLPKVPYTYMLNGSMERPFPTDLDDGACHCSEPSSSRRPIATAILG